MTTASLDIPEFTKKVKEELRVFSNFSAILNKADNDGYIKIILESLGDIFRNELNFAIKGRLSRTPKAKGEKEDAKPEKAC